MADDFKLDTFCSLVWEMILSDLILSLNQLIQTDFLYWTRTRSNHIQMENLLNSLETAYFIEQQYFRLAKCGYKH